MLVITRKIGEGVVIGGEISVRIIDIRGGQVRLGFEAPAACRIFRNELVAKVKEENETASAWLPADISQLAGVHKGALK